MHVSNLHIQMHIEFGTVLMKLMSLMSNHYCTSPHILHIVVDPTTMSQWDFLFKREQETRKSPTNKTTQQEVDFKKKSLKCRV